MMGKKRGGNSRYITFHRYVYMYIYIFSFRGRFVDVRGGDGGAGGGTERDFLKREKKRKEKGK